MRITAFLPAVAIAVLASSGSASASAAEQFATLDGVAAVPMTSEHMGAIRGTVAPGAIFVDSMEGNVVIVPNDQNPDSPPPLVVVDGVIVVGG